MLRPYPFLKHKDVILFMHLHQRFLTSVPQEFLKHAIPDDLVRGTDLLPLRLSNKQMTTSTQQKLSDVNESTLYLFFCQIGYRILVVCTCHEMKKVENR